MCNSMCTYIYLYRSDKAAIEGNKASFLNGKLSPHRPRRQTLRDFRLKLRNSYMYCESERTRKMPFD